MTIWEQLTIYASEFDCWEHQPLHQVLLGMARRKGLTGVTVVRAISGYGKHGIFHTLNELDSSTELSALPLLVTVIAVSLSITEFFSLVKHMLKDKFVTCQTIKVFSAGA